MLITLALHSNILITHPPISQHDNEPLDFDRVHFLLIDTMISQKNSVQNTKREDSLQKNRKEQH